MGYVYSLKEIWLNFFKIANPAGVLSKNKISNISETVVFVKDTDLGVDFGLSPRGHSSVSEGISDVVITEGGAVLLASTD